MNQEKKRNKKVKDENKYRMENEYKSNKKHKYNKNNIIKNKHKYNKNNIIKNKENKDILQNIFVVIGIALICDFLWGSAFPCIKFGYKIYGIGPLETNNQILFAGIRFVIAGCLVILFLCMKEKKFIYPKSIGAMKKVMILSLFQTILQYIFFYIGLARTTGVKGSVIEASNVFVAIFVSSVIFRQEKLSMQKIVGSIIGFAGVIVININGLTLDFGLGDGLILISTFAYAMSSVLLKKYAKDENTVMLSGYQFLFGGVVMSIIALLMGGNIDFESEKIIANISANVSENISANIGVNANSDVSSTEAIVAAIGILLYLAFISAMAYSLWSILLAHNPVSKVAVLGFMNPVFGVILSAVMLGETGEAFGIKSLVALVCVSVGVWVVYKKK